jgi:hypothetical protein
MTSLIDRRSTLLSKLSAKPIDFPSVINSYLQDLEQGLYDPYCAVAIVNELINHGLIQSSASTVYLYLHAAYVSNHHARIFQFNAAYRQGARPQRKEFSQYLMYCYEQDFINHLKAEVLCPTIDLRLPSETACINGLILTACDEHYFNKYLRDIIPGLHVPDKLHLHVGVLDPSDSTLQLLEQRASHTSNLGFSALDSRLHHHYTDHPHIAGKEQQLTIYACHRFFLAHELLKLAHAPLLIVDADTDFVESRFAEAFKSLESIQFDVGIARWSNDMSPGTSYMADVMVYKPTVSAREFLNLVTRYIRFYMQSDLAYWTLDQVALNAIDHYMRFNHPDYKFFDLNQHPIKQAGLTRHIGSHHFRQEVALRS